MRTYLILSLVLISLINTTAQNFVVRNEQKLNTSGIEYAPTFLDSNIVFITGTPTSIINKKIAPPPPTGIFLSKTDISGQLEKPTVFATELATGLYDGAMSYNATINTLFFTRGNLKNGNGKPVKAKDGKIKLKIYTAINDNGVFKNITEHPVSNNEYDCAYPTTSADGKRLYFSSNRPGGYGGMDLYVCMKINDKWSEPVNLGPKINTTSDEIYPFIHSDGTIYFSSNGKKGMGGYDVFFTRKTEDGWVEATNLGAPINSADDDFAFIIDNQKKSGYFTSNRVGGLGDLDIYSFKGLDTLSESIKSIAQAAPTSKTISIAAPEKSPVELVVPKPTTATVSTQPSNNIPVSTPQPTKIDIAPSFSDPVKISEEIAATPNKMESLADPVKKDTLPMPKKEAEVKQVNVQTTYPESKVEIAKLAEKPTKSKKSKKNTNTAAPSIQQKPVIDSPSIGQASTTPSTNPSSNKDIVPTETPIVDETASINIPILVVVKEYKENIPISNINFTLIDMRVVGDASIVTDSTGAVSTFRNSKGNELNFSSIQKVSYTTDENGKCQINLLQGQKYLFSFNIKGFQPKFITKTMITGDAIVLALLDKSDIVPVQNTSISQAPTPTESNTVELRNIYYNYGESSIRADVQKELDNLVVTLKNNPTMNIELASYTDSRGKAPFNLKLSQRRADSLRSYLLVKGIEANRVKAVGYGETHLKNKCADLVACDESEHQLNRRTEVKVLTTNPSFKVVYENNLPEVVSVKPNINVAPPKALDDSLSQNNKAKVEMVSIQIIDTTAKAAAPNDTLSSLATKVKPAAKKFKKFLVVIGAYSKLNLAEDLLEKAKKMGFPEAQIVMMPETQLYAVYIKGFRKQKQAQDLMNLVNRENDFIAEIQEY
jgi:outer membrane protein OmpA-like peptidoglycan-associated protein